MRVLLVEDEAPLRETLAARLAREGFIVDAASNGEEGLYLAKEIKLDVAIIDLGLPKLSGIELITQVREINLKYPILILTARSSWRDKVEGLKAGADDYLVKPFHAEELIARLNALLRRAGGWTQSILNCGPIFLDTNTHAVKLHQEAIELTTSEYRILEYFMMHVGVLITKTELTEHVYHQDYDRDSNVVEVFIGRLRKKLDPDNTLKPIETIRGRGYRFVIPQRT